MTPQQADLARFRKQLDKAIENFHKKYPDVDIDIERFPESIAHYQLD